MLKLVHTADWHLGRQFRSFPEDGALKLSRARLEVLDRILLTRRSPRGRCRAVRWRPVRRAESRRPSGGTRPRHAAQEARSTRPVFLLPGNHDPLTTDSVWAKGHKFRGPAAGVGPRRRSRRLQLHASQRRRALRGAVHVEGRPARPDRDASRRAQPGDERIRIGMVHGSTFDARTGRRTFRSIADAAARARTRLPGHRRHARLPLHPAGPPASRRRSIRARRSRRPSTSRTRVTSPSCSSTGGAWQRCAPSASRSWTWEECTVTIDRRAACAGAAQRPDRPGPASARRHESAGAGVRRGRGADRGAAGHRRPGTRAPAFSSSTAMALTLETATVDRALQDLPAVLQSAVAAPAGGRGRGSGAAARRRARAVPPLPDGEAKGLLMRLVRHLGRELPGDPPASIWSSAPGLNVLYGPNDLGKSTLAAAIRAALLVPPSGSPKQTRMRRGSAARVRASSSPSSTTKGAAGR